MTEAFKMELKDDWPFSGNCKNGWTKFGKGCFKLVTRPDKWENANTYCAAEATGTGLF